MTDEERCRKTNNIVDMLIALGYDQMILDGSDINSLIDTIENSTKDSFGTLDL